MNRKKIWFHSIWHLCLSSMLLLMLIFYMEIPACAEDFSTTNVQVLYGGSFHDPFFGNDTIDGRMTTITLEHFGTWAYGDNYFFVDFLLGDFVNSSGQSTGSTSRVYGEWHPRLSLSKLSGHDLSFSIIKDVLIAGQINRDGKGFKADMLGMGTNLDIPGFNFVELDTYARKDNFNSLTYQVTVAWDLPFGRWPISLTGYVDINGTDTHGTEINGQPQLLLDAGSILGMPAHHLQIGMEWYFHHHNQLSSGVPQAMVKWVF